MAEVHYVVIVDIKKVTKDVEVLNPGTARAQAVAKEKVTEDMIHIVTKSDRGGVDGAVRKAIRYLEVELPNEYDESTDPQYPLNPPALRR